MMELLKDTTLAHTPDVTDWLVERVENEQQKIEYGKRKLTFLKTFCLGSSCNLKGRSSTDDDNYNFVL